jgi:hypothetical protein
MFLESDIYDPTNTTYLITPADLDQHVTWMKTVNKMMPAGSAWFIEVGHNGNGNIEVIFLFKDTQASLIFDRMLKTLTTETTATNVTQDLLNMLTRSILRWSLPSQSVREQTFGLQLRTPTHTARLAQT